MRLWRAWAAGVIIVALVGAAGPGFPATAPESVRLGLNFLPYGLHMGFFVAREQAWYREAGIEVEILKGEGSADALRRLGAGVVDFALADLGSLVVARTRGVKVRALGVVLDKDPSVMISLKSTGIRTPKDLEGKSIGAMTGAAMRDTWGPLAAVNNVDTKKVTWVDMPGSAYVSSLMAKKVHAIATYVTILPAFEVQAKTIGEEATALFYADFGVDTYGIGVSASEQTLQNKPDLVRRFVHVSLRGYAWSIENPDEAVRLYLKANPEANPERIRAEFRVTADQILTPFAAREGIGHYEDQKVIRTRDLTLKPRGIDPSSVPAKDIYTNEFLPKLFPKRGKI